MYIIYLYIHIFVHRYRCIYVYIYIYIHHIPIDAQMYVCIYIYIYMFFFPGGSGHQLQDGAPKHCLSLIYCHHEYYSSTINHRSFSPWQVSQLSYRFWAPILYRVCPIFKETASRCFFSRQQLLVTLISKSPMMLITFEQLAYISGWWYTYPSEKYESQLG